MTRLTLVGAGRKVSFESLEEAGRWLLKQAGVRKLAIARRPGGVWALCEKRDDGTRQVLIETVARSGMEAMPILFRKFYEEWVTTLGFEAVRQRKPTEALSRRKYSQPSYLISESAYIAAFGY